MSDTGASMARGQSEQSVSTPPDFMGAVRKRFGHIAWDLAASEDNTKAFEWFNEEVDSLKQPWASLSSDWLWLNPPFSNIRPWAAKCLDESQAGAKILFLVPASVGSNWFADYVHTKALIYVLSPRMKFVGHTNSYPKDLMLVRYEKFIAPHLEVWKWK